MGEELLQQPDDRPITKFEIMFDNVEEVSPLFSKCLIKVLYSGKNRNKVDIDREVADELAETLYNVPIVGEYIQDIEDFKSHGGRIEIEDNEIKFVHTTKPYGVVPSNTEIKWMSVQEKDGTVRDYLTCWGYLWTGRYPEAKRIIEKGNPQSLELDEESVDGYWFKENGQTYFKLTKGIISALTILGEKVPPAFESASITTYSLSNERAFRSRFNKMLRELREYDLLEQEVSTKFSQQVDDNEGDLESDKGGQEMGDEKLQVSINFELSHDDVKAKLYEAVNPADAEGNRSWTYSVYDVYEDRAILHNWDDGKFYRQYYTVENDAVVAGDRVEVIIKDLTVEESAALEGIKANLATLTQNYEALETEVKELRESKTQYEATQEELESLRNFKLNVEKVEKEAVITQFAAILADEDIQECKDNIDSLTKDEIESKLSVIAIRKKVSFAQNDDVDDVDKLIPDGGGSGDDDTPPWIKIVQEHKSKQSDV